MRIEIHEHVTQRPNGDRDPNRHPCHGFEVVVINGDKQSVLYSNDQYDPNWRNIQGTRTKYLDMAQKKAVEFSDTLHCGAILIPTLLPSKKQELRDKIARYAKELEALESEE